MSDLTIEVKNDYMLGRMNDKTLHIVMIEQQQEIERLNNIINELEKWLLHNSKTQIVYDEDYYMYIYDKLQDLKGEK